MIQIEIEIDKRKFKAGWFRACKVIDETDQDYIELSNRLNEYYNDSDNCDRNFKPQENTLIAVYIPEFHRWERGFVNEICTVNVREKAHVFLIDIGTYSQFHCGLNYMQELPEWFNTNVMECRSFKVSLYGIVPAQKKDETLSKKSITQWTTPAVHLMMYAIKNYPIICLKERHRFEEIVLGDIYFGNTLEQMDNLNTSLIKLGFAKSADDCKDINYKFDGIPKLVSDIRKSKEFDNNPIKRKKLYPSLAIKGIDDAVPKLVIEYHPYQELEFENNYICDFGDN